MFLKRVALHATVYSYRQLLYVCLDIGNDDSN
jgi:hypothetical protein